MGKISLFNKIIIIIHILIKFSKPLGLSPLYLINTVSDIGETNSLVQSAYLLSSNIHIIMKENYIYIIDMTGKVVNKSTINDKILNVSKIFQITDNFYLLACTQKYLLSFVSISIEGSYIINKYINYGTIESTSLNYNKGTTVQCQIKYSKIINKLFLVFPERTSSNDYKMTFIFYNFDYTESNPSFTFSSICEKTYSFSYVNYLNSTLIPFFDEIPIISCDFSESDDERVTCLFPHKKKSGNNAFSFKECLASNNNIGEISGIFDPLVIKASPKLMWILGHIYDESAPKISSTFYQQKTMTDYSCDWGTIEPYIFQYKPISYEKFKDYQLAKAHYTSENMITVGVLFLGSDTSCKFYSTKSIFLINDLNIKPYQIKFFSFNEEFSVLGLYLITSDSIKYFVVSSPICKDTNIIFYGDKDIYKTNLYDLVDEKLKQIKNDDTLTSSLFLKTEYNNIETETGGTISSSNNELIYSIPPNKNHNDFNFEFVLRFIQNDVEYSESEKKCNLHVKFCHQNCLDCTNFGLNDDNMS